MKNKYSVFTSVANTIANAAINGAEIAPIPVITEWEQILADEGLGIIGPINEIKTKDMVEEEDF